MAKKRVGTVVIRTELMKCPRSDATEEQRLLGVRKGDSTRTSESLHNKTLHQGGDSRWEWAGMRSPVRETLRVAPH